MIYLDNNATTLIADDVADAMYACFREQLANPASSHEAGRRARRRLESCREAIASLLGAREGGMQADRIVFTSGGTESNNLALFGFAAARPGRIVISSVEHPSVTAAAERLASQGREVIRLEADADGKTRTDQLGELLQSQTAIVSVMWANNETGVIQPVEEIAEICRDSETPFHCDAVQAVGKLPLQFQAIPGLTAITWNAHKLHGPRAVGGLLMTADTTLEPLLVGGFQQLATRPGTESVELAVGMGAALECAITQLDERTANMRCLRDRLEAGILDNRPDAVIIGRRADRLPHTSCVAFPGVDRQALLMHLDQVGVACSTGSACASGSSEPSPVLTAMGLAEEIVEGALRFSLSCQTTEAEIDKAVERIDASLSQVAY